MKWLIYYAKWLKLVLWFLRYTISKFEIRQTNESRKPSVNTGLTITLTLDLRDSSIWRISNFEMKYLKNHSISFNHFAS